MAIWKPTTRHAPRLSSASARCYLGDPGGDQSWLVINQNVSWGNHIFSKEITGKWWKMMIYLMVNQHKYGNHSLWWDNSLQMTIFNKLPKDNTRSQGNWTGNHVFVPLILVGFLLQIVGSIASGRSGNISSDDFIQMWKTNHKSRWCTYLKWCLR